MGWGRLDAEAHNCVLCGWCSKLVKIKKSKLRGEVSQGMICSEAELGLALESDGILILEDDAPVGSLVQDWGSVASRLLIKAEATALETPNDASHGLPK